MIDRILNYGLEDHARNSDIRHIFINLSLIMNLAREAHIQDVDIFIDKRNLFANRRIHINLLNIVSEEISHGLNEFHRLVRALHHGKLGSGVQSIEQEVGVDLSLKVDKLNLPHSVLHHELMLLELTLPSHGRPDFLDIGLQPHGHLLKGFTHD